MDNQEFEHEEPVRISYIVKALQTKEIKVKDLPPFTKKTLVFTLLEEQKFTQAFIAELMECTPAYISKLNKERLKSYLPILAELDINTIAAGHITQAERLKQRMAADKDWHGVWKVSRELIEDLQSLGFLRRAPEELNISLESQAKAFQELFGVKLERGTVTSNDHN